MKKTDSIQRNLFSNDKIDPGKIQRFPPLHVIREDDNPAIGLFGRRYYKDQTVIEHLIEFLLVFVSPKSIGDSYVMEGIEGKEWVAFPPQDKLNEWQENTPIKYSPRPRLTLKLFSFLNSSNLESRHNCHLQKFNELVINLKEKIYPQSAMTPEQILTLIEQVLAGFVGIARNRVWCAQSFLPLSPGLIAGETLWKKSIGKKYPNLSWEEAWDPKEYNNSKTKKSPFTFNSHDFLARGGEILYLQLCNLFKMSETPEVKAFERNMAHEKGTVLRFKKRIENGIYKILNISPGPELYELSEWIEKADSDTRDREKSRLEWATCGWCPSESWPEAYLFAYEICNILESLLDPIEKIEMLKICCILQVMRSLCAQSARYWGGLTDDLRELGSKNGFAWIITDPNTTDRYLKEASRRNLIKTQEMIHGAIRCMPGQKYTSKPPYKNADEQGPSLFLSFGKRIEFIAPYKGPGARFVLNETLLRYFVLALIPPGERRRLTTFREALYQHYGAAIVGSQLKRAVRWTYPGQNIQLSSAKGDWFENQLRATGFLIPLSDAVSLIRNPFAANSQSE